MVSKVTKRAIILLFIVAVILIFPLAYYNGKGESEGYFGGSDDQGPEYLESLGYHPWVQPIWEPPSGEIESLLFAIQSAIGAIIIGYVLGYWRGQSKMKRKNKKDEDMAENELKWE